MICYLFTPVHVNNGLLNLRPVRARICHFKDITRSSRTVSCQLCAYQVNTFMPLTSVLIKTLSRRLKTQSGLKPDFNKLIL